MKRAWRYQPKRPWSGSAHSGGQGCEVPSAAVNGLAAHERALPQGKPLVVGNTIINVMHLYKNLHLWWRTASPAKRTRD